MHDLPWARLRTALAAPPTAHTWQQICLICTDLFQTAPDCFRMEVVPYLKQHIGHIPDFQRICPPAFRPLYLTDPSHPALDLFRVLRLEGWPMTQTRREKLLQSPALEKLRWIDGCTDRYHYLGTPTLALQQDPFYHIFAKHPRIKLLRPILAPSIPEIDPSKENRSQPMTLRAWHKQLGQPCYQDDLLLELENEDIIFECQCDVELGLQDVEGFLAYKRIQNGMSSLEKGAILGLLQPL